MTKSILECHKILGCECCGNFSVLDEIQKKTPEESKTDKLDLNQKDVEANLEKKEKFATFQGVEKI